ncbi:MAG: VanZ family protein [Planctomycetaceae bacterium]|jgi:VanZ family protein|nr:VanZ family protein [Planctomycetaceae bacterium]
MKARVILAFRYLAIFYMIFLTLLLWLPDPRVLVFGWEPSDDVGGYMHLLTFLVLGFLFELDRRGFSFEFLGLLLLCYAVLTEVGQIFSPSREFDLQDMIQNFAGIIVGLEIGNIMKNIYKFTAKSP